MGENHCIWQVGIKPDRTLSKYEVLIGRNLRARTLSAQKGEVGIACKVINRMTSLGMLLYRKVA